MNADRTRTRDIGPPPSLRSSPILSFENVAYSYPAVATPALDDVSLGIEEGELCVLAGLTGEGKSTLLRAACGLVPHFHGGSFAGEVTVAGLNTRSHGPAQLGAFVGVLFQDPETQLVMGSVRAELALAQESRGASAGAVARGVEEVALALGVDHLLDRSTAELSGGEKQRVALGAALVGSPRVVLLDEPTSQLDPVAGDELIALLRRLNRDWEVTFVIAEHRLERCLADADRVITMAGGKVVQDGDAGSFLKWAGERAPALQTPGARMFSLAGLDGAPVGVKPARAILRSRGLIAAHLRAPAARPCATEARSAGPRGSAVGTAGRTRPALRMRGVWQELRGGRAILRGVSVTFHPGESVVLMGRNGAGKSTLLRHAAGLLPSTRGTIERSGRVALLLQNPGDYFLHDRVSEEASADALAAVGLTALGARNPRDLSGGQRQRLALAIVTGGAPPAVLALDEPTRGMDRQAKAELAAELRRRAEQGQAVIVATHDPEFAAACAERALLMADGGIIFDGTVRELLAGGWYFATETARILGGAGPGPAAAVRERLGADGGGLHRRETEGREIGRCGEAEGECVALLPEEGAALLRAWAEEQKLTSSIAARNGLATGRVAVE